MMLIIMYIIIIMTCMLSDQSHFCFLQVGDIVTVTAMNVNGQWEGEVNGRQGFFPFNYIEFITDDDELDGQS